MFFYGRIVEIIAPALLGSLLRPVPFSSVDGIARRSVSRVLSAVSRSRDGHSSGTPLAKRLVQPTRAAGSGNRLGRSPVLRSIVRCGPYSVLLPVGFTVPALLPDRRCALTAPFHPYLRRNAGGLLSVALSLGSPPPGVTRHRVSLEPGLSSARHTGQQPSGHLTG